MTLTDNHIKDLIAGYLCDKLSVEQEQELYLWISAAPENEAYFNAQREIWISTDAKALGQYDSQKAYTLFKHRVARKQNEQKQRNRLRRLWYAAASIVVLLIISSLIYIGQATHTNQTIADVVIETPIGSRTRLTLPDGTTVWLNAHSKITYSQGFGIENRHVSLSGEGFFEVKENKELPFVVESKHLKVCDLGTKFNFKDYSDDERSVVSLTEGKIALSNLMQQSNDRILIPGQHAVLEKTSGIISVEKAPVEISKQWIAGIVTFNGEGLGEIAKELERYYDIDISLKRDRTANRHFFGTFNLQEQSLHDILDAFAATGKLRYKSYGRKVIIY